LHLELNYGKSKICYDIDGKRLMALITPKGIAASPDPQLEVENALKSPIDAKRIEELPVKGKTIAIAVDDITRTTPTQVILPAILESLDRAGARREDVKLIVALGTHRRMTKQEMKQKYGSRVMEEYEVVNHSFDDDSELEYLGKAQEGNLPVFINKAYAKADIRIATGNLIPHFNVGWAGGAKILLPGLAGEETVGRMHAHSAITTPNALGRQGTPTRRLIEAFGEKVGIHLLVNTVIDQNGRIMKVFTGHFMKAHRIGVRLARQIYGVRVTQKADITVSSSHPADIEFWQGQKGLFSADLVTKEGGGIVLLTPCPEGIATMHPDWVEYLQHTAKELMEMYERGTIENLVAFGLALNVAHVRDKHIVCLVSGGISEAESKKIGFKKFGSIEEAVKHLSRIYGSDSRINVLTHGGDTCPVLT
jgi:nickel-dependent lactate racemase